MMAEKRSVPEGPLKGPLEGRGAGQAGSNMVGGHIPVLLRDVIEHLNIIEGGTYLDATFGGGGYSRAILNVPGTRVVAIDRDPNARRPADEMISEFGNRLIFCQGRFGDLDRLAISAGFDHLDGVVFDIGVSSMQLDDGARGFSFQADGPLDMRMSGEGRSAADLVNELGEGELAFIFRLYGEERRARAIARRVVGRRKTAHISRTFELTEIIMSVLGPIRPHRKHPATRVFQALRIAVNEELHELAYGLGAAERLLRAGGRLVVVDFHSLEDRIVKQFLRARAGLNPKLSRHLPPSDENIMKPSFQIINRRPVVPGEKEMMRNPRARSARLRAAVRLDAEAWAFEPASFGLPEAGSVGKN